MTNQTLRHTCLNRLVKLQIPSYRFVTPNGIGFAEHMLRSVTHRTAWLGGGECPFGPTPNTIRSYSLHSFFVPVHLLISRNPMKTILPILTLGLLTLLFSCGQPNETQRCMVVATDTLRARLEKIEKERLQARKETEEQDRIDSLLLAKVLTEALAIANQNSGKDTFQQKYEARPDSTYHINVEISLAHHFTRLFPHLIIRRQGPQSIYLYIDIYTKNGRQYEKVLSHRLWVIEYRNDTIRDINGDGLKDFVVNWYGSNGCCLKGFSNIYLLRPDKQTFSDSFEFINPTFSPKEKLIRGVCYGHPGYTELYKYKWDGEKVDTLEYVSYQKDDQGEKTGKVVISPSRSYDDTTKNLKILTSVPAEYRKIEGYDWFTGKGYD